MVRSLRALLMLALFAACFTFSSASAWAEPTEADRKQAAKLFKAGMARMAQGQFAEACKAFEQGYDLARGLGIQYQLARCNEERGRLVSAHRHYEEVASIAQRVGQWERERVSRERARALLPRLSRLSIRVAEPGARVSVRDGDGQLLPEADWSSGVAVDRGTYAVEVTAPGLSPWRKSVEVSEEGHTEIVEVPSFQSTADPPGTEAGPFWTPLRTAGVIVAAVGVVGLGASAITVGVAKSRDNEALDHCVDAGCTEQGLELNDEARTLGDVATAVFVGGALLTAAGLVMVIVPPSEDGSQDAARLRLQPTFGVSQAGLVVGGSF